MNEQQQISIPEGEYAKYLANMAADIADQRVKDRETKWRTFFGSGVTILAILGYANFSSIETKIEENLSIEISKKIPTEVRSFIENNRAELIGKTISDLQSDIEARLALLQLVIVASEMRQGTSYTNEARSAVVSLLKIVSKNRELVASTQFYKPLEDIVDSFIKADQETYIDNIDETLRDVISSYPVTTFFMLQHYGLRVLGSTNISDSDVGRLNYYASTSDDSFNSPENSAPFVLGYAFMSAGYKRDQRGEAIFKDSKHWSPAERGTFLRIATILKEGGFANAPTGKTDRVQLIMSKVFKAYEREFSVLSKTAEIDNESVPGDAGLEVLRSREEDAKS